MLYTLPSNRSMTSDGHGGDQPLSRAASGQLPPTTPVSPTASEIEPAAEVPGAKTPPRRTRLQAMQERIDLLEKELSESEHTHKLRYVIAVLKNFTNDCQLALSCVRLPYFTKVGGL